MIGSLKNLRRLVVAVAFALAAIIPVLASSAPAGAHVPPNVDVNKCAELGNTLLQPPAKVGVLVENDIIVGAISGINETGFNLEVQSQCGHLAAFRGAVIRAIRVLQFPFGFHYSEAEGCRQVALNMGRGQDMLCMAGTVAHNHEADASVGPGVRAQCLEQLANGQRVALIFGRIFGGGVEGAGAAFEDDPSIQPLGLPACGGFHVGT